MNKENENHATSKARKIPLSVRTISWSESMNQDDLEVPGTPRTPRTSTTPGKFIVFEFLYFTEVIKNVGK